MAHRKDLMIVFAILVAVGLAAGFLGCKKSAPADGQEEAITLTYANFPPAVTFPCVQMEEWKRRVEEATSGRVKVTTFPGSTLLDPKNMLSGVMAGTADMGCFAMSYMPGRFPVSEAVDLPHGFPSAEVASLVLFDLIQKLQPKEFADVKIITMFTCQPAGLMTSKPIAQLSDLKGVQLRVSGTSADALTRLGATPVAMAMSSTPEAIQRGTVTGIVSSLEVLQDMNFATYCKNATRMDALPVITFAVVMNKDKWNALPDDVKKVIDTMARSHAQWTGRYEDAHTEEAIEWAKKNHGLTLHRFPAEEDDKVAELLKPMFEEYVARVGKAGVDGKQALAEIQTLRDAIEKK